MPPRALPSALLFLTSCAVGAAAERQQQDARLSDQLEKVQEAACLKPTISPSCARDLRLAYERPPSGRVEMWCAEDGWAHAKGPEVDGPMPLAVWNALERVIQASDGCVHTSGERVIVTWKDAPKTCPDPRFDIHELLDLAYGTAQEGPTPTPRAVPRPSAKCPPLTGPLWPAATPAREP